MGRAKMKMELIEKEKSRDQNFKRRKKGLIKKLDQLRVLCDVPSCAIIYGPKQGNDAIEPEIWPQRRDEGLGLINAYKENEEDSGKGRFGLNDYFQNREKFVEDKLTKLRKKNMEEKYPTDLNHEIFNRMTEGELRQFAESLSEKAKHVRSKIQSLKGKGAVDAKNLMHFGDTGMNGPFYPPPPPRPPPPLLLPMHAPIPIHYHHQQLDAINQNNSIMMLLTNGDDQFGGGSTSRGNFQSAQFWSQDSNEASTSSSRGHGVVDPIIYNPMPLACDDSFNWTNCGQEDIVGATSYPRINIESEESTESYFSPTPLKVDESSLALQPYVPEMNSNSSCTSSYTNAESEFLIDQVAYDWGFNDAAKYFSGEQGSPKSN